MTSARDDHGFDLLGLLDRALDEDELRRTARHLAECPRCTEEVRLLEAGAEAARSLRGSLDGAVPELVERTLDRIAVEGAGAAAFGSKADRGGRTEAAVPRLRLVAAVVVALGLGWAAGWATHAGSPSGGAGEPGTVATIPEPPTHALLLLSRGRLGGTMAGRLEAYGRWAAELRADDRLAMAEALSPSAYLVDSEEGAPRQPAAGEADALGSLLGFYLLRVPSDDIALDIARESPHIGFGGEILVRPIYPTPRVEP